MAEHLVGDALVPVRPFADREVAALALLAFAAVDREGDDDTVTDLQGVPALRPDLDYLAHEFMAQDVAALHAGHIAVVEMQVRAADRAARHLHDGVARVLDPGIGNLVAVDVLGAMPTQRPHGRTSSLVVVRQCDPDIASVSKTTSRVLDRSASAPRGDRRWAITILKVRGCRGVARCHALKVRANRNFGAPSVLYFGASL